MAALTKKRATKVVRATSMSLAAAASTYYFQGGLACFNTSTGLVNKGGVSTTLVPIGTFAEDKELPAAGGEVLVNLHRELEAQWFANATAGDAVASTDVGKLCYILDDQTVAVGDAANTRSVAGRIWKVDALKGVLVELRQTGGSRLGGLDA